MIPSKTVLKLGLAIATLSGMTGMVAMASPASAHTVAPQGTVNCAFSASATFSPPLTPGYGTLGIAYETMTLTNQTLSACTGSTTPTGFLPATGTGKDLSVKFPGILVSGGRVHENFSGGCSDLRDGTDPYKLKSAISWVNGIKATKATLFNLGQTSVTLPNVFLGFSGTMTHGSLTKGSFAGKPIQMNLYFDTPSSTAMFNCYTNQTGSVSSAMVISSLSSVTIG